MDIIAEKDGRPLFVTVKGYPRRTEKTNPSVQAAHWFKDAIFDILEYRGDGERIDPGLALPVFPRYRNIAQKIKWLKPIAKYYCFWVREDGTVTIEQGLQISRGSVIRKMQRFFSWRGREN